MVCSFNVEVHSNGITIIPLGFGESGNSMVFQKANIEDALLEMYHRCSQDWCVGDKVKIEKRITTAST